MIGSIAIGIAFVGSLVAGILYLLVARGRTQYLTAARVSTHVTIWASFLAAGALLYYIFNYRFDINYVYEHVSRSLSTPLLFSTFYASQEGSFMLWLVLSAIVAVFLMPYASRQRYEAHVMSVYLCILFFLALMLLLKSPFTSIYAAHPGEVPAGFMPQDGKGLNPSLENLWIAIHPPMLFTGFTLLAVPFAFAVAGLWRRDFQGWVVTSLPWTLGAGMILGFGIILGGFWAYESLGWGGYWGWDPVENASLLPWLVTVAAFHTMLTQKKTGGLVKMNILMTLIAYGLVIYASFLTRSGVLADASVHSFVAPGQIVFWLLLAALVIFVGGPLILFFTRMKDMRARGDEYKFYSRETALSIGSAVLGASALVVFIGTSSPIFAKKVDTDFYGSLHIPIAIVLMLVNGLSLLLKWRSSSPQETLKKSLWSFGLSVLLTGCFYWLGIRDINYDLIILAALFSLFINLDVAYKLLKGKFVVMITKGEGETKQRVMGALKWTFSLGLLAMLIGTKGDYYKFGDVILDYGLYWLAFTIVLAGAFVMFGSVRFKADTRFIGAYIAHTGIALFILGVVASSHYEEKAEFEFVKGQTQKAFGRYELTYVGEQLLPPANQHYLINIRDNDGHVETASPVLFLSAFDDFKTLNPKPSIVKYASRDFYFTAKGYETVGGLPFDSLTKGQSIPIFNGKYSLTFDEFDFPQEERAKMMSQQAFRVKAKVTAKKKDDLASRAIPLELSVTRSLASDDAKMEDVMIPGTHLHLQLAELQPNLQDRSQSKIFVQSLDEDNPPPKPQKKIFIEAFIKPYINLVWAGVLILVTGFGFAMMRRRREAMTAIEKAEKAFEKLKGVKASSDELHSPVAPSHAAKIPVKKKERA